MRNDGVTVVVKKVVIALITALYDMLWDGEKAQVGVPHQVWRPMHPNRNHNEIRVQRNPGQSLRFPHESSRSINTLRSD